MERYFSISFGRDCLGNVAGWRVYDRADGTLVATFPADIYTPGSHATARRDAEDLVNALNQGENR